MCSNIKNTSGQHHHGGEHNPGLQQAAHGLLHLPVVEFLWVRGAAGGNIHRFFMTPCMIISIPSARMTSVKVARKKETRAFTKYRAPSREPQSTPSMTGNANPG